MPKITLNFYFRAKKTKVINFTGKKTKLQKPYDLIKVTQNKGGDGRFSTQTQILNPLFSTFINSSESNVPGTKELKRTDLILKPTDSQIKIGMFIPLRRLSTKFLFEAARIHMVIYNLWVSILSLSQFSSL